MSQQKKEREREPLFTNVSMNIHVTNLAKCLTPSPRCYGISRVSHVNLKKIVMEKQNYILYNKYSSYVNSIILFFVHQAILFLCSFPDFIFFCLFFNFFLAEISCIPFAIEWCQNGHQSPGACDSKMQKKEKYNEYLQDEARARCCIHNNNMRARRADKQK